LTCQQVEQLQNDAPLSQFHQTKLEREARKNWDLFYKRNQTHFFKDRHWTTREFEQLMWNQLDGTFCPTTSGTDTCTTPNPKLTLFELGCGVGNFFFPLLELNSNLSVFACDFSPRAVDLIHSNPAFDADRCVAFEADLSDCELFDSQLKAHFTSSPQADLASLIFVLSAVTPSKMVSVLRNAFKVLI
jgi:methyltransferase-like protein 6